jgi:hypothetical protein
MIQRLIQLGPEWMAAIALTAQAVIFFGTGTRAEWNVAFWASLHRRKYSDDNIDYEKLIDVLLKAKFKWLLCGYLHPLLHRLGRPIWARDVELLCVRMKAGHEGRTECLWANYFPKVDKAQRVLLPPGVRGQIRSIADAASLSFSALDSKIDQGLDVVAKDFSVLVPYLVEMNRRLSAPGKRTDLRKGAPVGLSWMQWVESKRHKLGRSLRTIQYLLKGQTESSRDRQMLLAQPRAILRSVTELVLDSPMEIALEMARLVLEMRDYKKDSKVKKLRLEMLAQRFLEISGEDTPSDSAPGGDIRLSDPIRVN